MKKPPYLLLSLVCLFYILAPHVNAQTNLKKIKKEISVKGVKSVKPVPFSDQLYIYQSKNDTGLWDTSSKQVLLSGIKELSPSSFGDSWIDYSTSSEYGIYDVVGKQILVHSPSPMWLKVSSDSNVVNIINSDVIGLIDLRLNQSFWVELQLQNDSTLFYSKEFSYLYDGESKEVSYGKGDSRDGLWAYEESEEEFGDEEYYEELVRLRHKVGYAWESGRGFNIETGEIVAENLWNITQFREYFVTSLYGKKSFYDSDFKLLFKDVRDDQYKIEHFQLFVDEAITKVELVGGHIYMCRFGAKRRFYDALEMEPISPVYDFTFKIGRDFIHGGYSYFTAKDGSGYGLYNTDRGELFAPKYRLVEKRSFPDGSYWYRVDNNLYSANKVVDSNSSTMSWNPKLENTTTIINHLGIANNHLIVSSRSTSADTHDSSYYTATNFDDGSGVITMKDSSWVFGYYHTVTPYRGHYIAMKIGSSYRNASWLQTTLFDKDFNSITDEKFGVSFIHNGMLIVLSGLNLKVYDIEKRKIIRDLGLMNEVDADFRLIDGYLVIGDNNYSRKKELIGMDISDLISPKGDLVKVPGFHGRYKKGRLLNRFRFLEIIGEELVTIGKIKKDEPTDRELHSLKIDAIAIFDLRSRKIITPWVDRILMKNDENSIFYLEKFGKDAKGLNIPISEIRDTFNN